MGVFTSWRLRAIVSVSYSRQIFNTTAHGHICGLARTSKDKFFFLGGDTAHHAGEFRPTTYLPLPPEINPSPFDLLRSASVFASAMFESVHSTSNPGEYTTTPFYPFNPAANVSVPETQACVDKMERFDASPHVFVIIAHNASVLGVLHPFPRTITTWDRTDEKIISRWRFLRDFEKAVQPNEG
jgi:hypothetical protein